MYIPKVPVLEQRKIEIVPRLTNVKALFDWNNVQLGKEIGVSATIAGYWLRGKHAPGSARIFNRVKQHCDNLLSGKMAPGTTLIPPALEATETVVRDILIGEMEQVEINLVPPEMPDEWWASFDEPQAPASSPNDWMAGAYAAVMMFVGFFVYWIGQH
jgi:hypothetical protein